MNMAIAIMTFVLVIYMLSNILIRYTYFNTSRQSYAYYDIEENQVVKAFFVFYPFAIVMALMRPSFAVLYTLAEIHEPKMIIKVIRHQ